MRIGKLVTGVWVMVLVLVMHGCNIINPEEPVPAYLKVDRISFDASGLYSSDSNNIKDLWVYINGQLAGTYEIPFEVPIIADGVTQLRLIPGITPDGIASIHSFYPYFSNIDTSLMVNPGETIEMVPALTYLNNHKAVVNEDFEKPTVTLEASSSSDSVLLQSGQILLDGSKSGILYSTAAGQEMKIQSKSTFNYIDRVLSPYLEFDYMSTIPFKVGVMVDANSEQYELVLRATDGEKKKVYVDFTNEMGVFNTSADLKVFFEGISEQAGDYIVVDNVRLLVDK